MKNFIKKHWALLGWLTCFAVNNIYGILENSGLSSAQIEIVKGLGAAFYAYYWTSKHNINVVTTKLKTDAKNND